VLDKKYTVFGRVISGMEYVDTVERGEPPANPSTILHAYIAADNPPPYTPPPPPPPPVLAPAPAPTPVVAPAAAKPVAKKPVAKK
jgi:cyclophilin family peptidyl-prolyl cis-trans isomerase